MTLANPTAWSDHIQQVLDAACMCLETCTPLGAPRCDPDDPESEFNCYKIHSDEWPGDCCNALIAKVTRVFLVDQTLGFPNQNVGNVKNLKCNPSQLAAEAQLRLFRPCGVTAGTTGTAPILPSGEELNNEAESSLIDLNALLCCLQCDPGLRDLNNLDMIDPRLQFQLTQATPFKSGDCYGWEINFVMTLAPCGFESS